MSNEPHLIKVAATAPSDNMRANEIAIKNAKTGKMNAVLAVMSIIVEKSAICRMLVPGTRSLLAKKRKVLIFQTKNPTD